MGPARKQRPGTGHDMAVLYSRKAGAHDHRPRRERTRKAVKQAAIKDQSA